MPDTWVSAAGDHPIPVANALMATIESGRFPDKLVILIPPSSESSKDTIHTLVKDVCTEYGLDSEVSIKTIPPLSEPAKVIETVKKVLSIATGQGSTIIEISSGPRIITTFLTVVASNNRIEGSFDIYTLERTRQLTDEQHYPLIPRPEFEFIDIQADTTKELTGPGDDGPTDEIFYLKREELPVLFNALYSTGTSSISVEHQSNILPELYCIELNRGSPAQVLFPTSPEEYAEARSKVGSRYGEQPRSELPEKQSFVGPLTSSILDFGNQEEIDQFIDPYRNRRLDQGNAATLAVFDTNLIQYWPAVQLGVAPELEDGLNGYAVVTGVRDELFDYDGEEKINSTHALEQAFGTKFESLFNQPKQTPRQLELGRKYFSRLERKLYTEKIKSKTRDKNIISACEELHQSTGFDLLLFSNDSGFISNARSCQVPSKRVQFPDSFPRKKDVTWEEVATALYLHAVQFGILELPKVDLYGIWKGKKPEAWETDMLAVECRSPVVAGQLKRYCNLVEYFDTSSQ